MRFLELKIPPLILALLIAGLMWMITWATPTCALAIPWKLTAACGLVMTGIVVTLLGGREFRQAHTTVNPLKPESSSALVVAGIYRLTRNPMYLGFLLMLLGWAVWLANALAFLPLPVFVLYMSWFQIRPEERALTKLFGQEYAAYQSRVRRWL